MGAGGNDRESGGAAALFSLLSAVHDHHTADDATAEDALPETSLTAGRKEHELQQRQPQQKVEQMTGSSPSSAAPHVVERAGGASSQQITDSSIQLLSCPTTGGAAPGSEPRPADPDAASRRHNWPRQAAAEQDAPNAPSQFSPIAVVEDVRGADWNAASPAVLLDLRSKEWVQATGTEWIPWVRGSPSLQPLRPLPIQPSAKCFYPSAFAHVTACPHAGRAPALVSQGASAAHAYQRTQQLQREGG